MRCTKPVRKPALRPAWRADFPVGLPPCLIPNHNRESRTVCKPVGKPTLRPTGAPAARDAGGWTERPLGYIFGEHENRPAFSPHRRGLGQAVNLLDPGYLFASLFWGSVGIAYFIYGKRQQSFVPLIGGVAMVAVSYLVGSALLMSAICVALIAGVYLLVREGY